MIEKNIFQSWYTKKLHPLIQDKINNLKKMNSEYNYRLYNDNEMDIFVNENFNGEIAECYNKLNIIVAKVDFWRYLILYKYGGVYLDMDSYISKPLDELIKHEDQAIITAEGGSNFYVQWGLIFSKGHPILKRTIELICSNIKNNSYPNNIHKMTGPTVYTKSINEIHKELFNSTINHGDIKRGTDITYQLNNISYRLYGIDYNDYFSFKHNHSHLLYVNKKHWRQEEAEKPLLISDKISNYEYIKSIFFKDNRIRKLEILNNYIDKVIYINLEERKDRRKSCEDLLNKIFEKDKIIRFNAIKDDNGSIGCTKSHIKCLKLAIENEWDNVLIVEDDIILTENKSEYIFEKLINDNFDVIVLGGTEISYNQFNYKLLECQTTGSYLVKKNYFKKLKYNFEKGLEKLLCTNIQNKFCIDQYWKKLQRVDNWKIIYPPLFIQKEDYSNIENKIVNYYGMYYKEKKNNVILNKILIYTFVYIVIKFIIYYNLNIEFSVLFVFFIDFGNYIYSLKKNDDPFTQSLKIDEFTSDIRIDNLTKQKCCLFNYAILKIKNKNITLSVPSEKFNNKLPEKISCNSSYEKLIQVTGIKNWESKKVLIEKGVWVLISDYDKHNAGHVLGDEVFAIWQSLCTFGLEKHDFNIITNNHSLHKQQYQCLTKKKIFHFDEFKNKEVSFEYLVIGMARNGYALGHTHPINGDRSINYRASYLPPFNKTFEAFRKYSYKIFNINEKSFQKQKRSILFLDKNEKVSMHNCKLHEINKIIKLVQEKHGNYNVKKINWNGMDIGDQIKEMVMADIVVSLPGSDLMNCIFLNPKSYIICPNRFISNGNKESSNEIDIWFKHTHKFIQISDVTLVKNDNQLYSKINDIDFLLKHIDNIISSMNILEESKHFLENSIDYYFSEEEQIKYFGMKPKSRYHTFKYCFDNLNKEKPIIVELGTSRSFVCGRFEGCNLDDVKYWEPNNPEKWDWSAGIFTKVFSNLYPKSDFHTVDLERKHINRCKIMNEDRDNITYHVSSSEYFLNNTDKKVDLLYLDTGDMTPIEETAQLHLREAKIIVEKDILADNGIILIDDVKSVVPKHAGEKSDLGKAKYSIPYFLENGYEVVMSEYQTILKKMRKYS